MLTQQGKRLAELPVLPKTLPRPDGHENYYLGIGKNPPAVFKGGKVLHDKIITTEDRWFVIAEWLLDGSFWDPGVATGRPRLRYFCHPDYALKALQESLVALA